MANNKSKQQAQETLEQIKTRQQTTVMAANQKHYAKRILELEKDLEAFRLTDAHKTRKPSIKRPAKGQPGEATAIVQWSDWHVDEVVRKKTVNGMNEYNPKIAEARAIKAAQNTVKLTNTQRHDVVIKNLILHLGGDFIGGYIHDELMQTNSMSPMEGIFFAKELLIAGIDYLLKHGDFESIVAVTNRGNHGRLTKKMQFANDYSMNLETFLYHSLANQYKDEPRIQFVIEESEVVYLECYKRTLRFFHGHQVKYMGGVGGLTVPLYKQIFRWNANRMAMYNFMCDKHTYSMPTPDCQVNGSLKGYDAYAAGHGFLMQEPLQSFTLLDSQRGITIRSKIFCE